MNNIKLGVFALGVIAPAQTLLAANEPARPNIAWYITEDTSPQYIALFNDGKGAKMPNLERFAKEAVVYTNAICNAPVSSAARTTLLTSCFAPRFGGALHRNLERFALPEGVEMFPKYLAEAGYFTTNAKKDDYNVVFDDTNVWQRPKAKSYDWREREDKSQPFFYMSTNVVTHEGRLLFDEKTYNSVKTVTDPKDVIIPPAFPDTELMRYTFATFYDKLALSDAEFGNMLDNLEKDGLKDDTIIFFFGDNGGTTPGTKGYTTNYGLRVPLVVYVPEKWREALGVEAGSVCDDFVSFMDFGATALSLAGVKQPEKIDGVSFLGKDAERVESVLCYGDRFDELYAFSRVLYSGKYRYARNYTPYHPQGLYTFYRYKSLAFMEWERLYDEGKLSGKQASFYEPQGAEELYDIESDPEELRNLATDPKFRKVLASMRSELDSSLVEKRDLGFYPEVILLEQAVKDPESFAKSHAAQIKRYSEVANLQRLSYKEAQKELLISLKSSDKVEKWWGLTNAAWFGGAVGKAEIAIAKSVVNAKDERSFMRSRAAVALVRGGESISIDQLYEIIANSKSLAEVLLVLNDVAYLRDAKLIEQMKLTPGMTPFSDQKMIQERMLFLNR